VCDPTYAKFQRELGVAASEEPSGAPSEVKEATGLGRLQVHVERGQIDSRRHAKGHFTAGATPVSGIEALAVCDAMREGADATEGDEGETYKPASMIRNHRNAQRVKRRRRFEIAAHGRRRASGANSIDSEPETLSG
jgi:hypothetical protein